MVNVNDPIWIDPLLLEQAEHLCKKRLENDSENRALLRSLAAIYRKLGNLREAAAVYERLFQLDPQDQEAGYLQAVFGGKDWLLEPKGIRAAPFALLNDFLSPEFHAGLLAFVMSVRDQFTPVLDGNGAYKPNSRQALEFRGSWERERFQASLLEELPRVIPRLHLQPSKPKIGPIELVLRAYQDGNFFKIHRDAPPGSAFANRVMNYVYYFHKVPRPYTGGELLLFDSDPEADTFTQSRFTRVVPEDNSLIIFPPNYYHCVVPIHCPSKEFADSRFVINGHVHKRAEACMPTLAEYVSTHEERR